MRLSPMISLNGCQWLVIVLLMSARQGLTLRKSFKYVMEDDRRTDDEILTGRTSLVQAEQVVVERRPDGQYTGHKTNLTTGRAPRNLIERSPRAIDEVELDELFGIKSPKTSDVNKPNEEIQPKPPTGYWSVYSSLEKRANSVAGKDDAANLDIRDDRMKKEMSDTNPKPNYYNPAVKQTGFTYQAYGPTGIEMEPGYGGVPQRKLGEIDRDTGAMIGGNSRKKSARQATGSARRANGPREPSEQDKLMDRLASMKADDFKHIQKFSDNVEAVRWEEPALHSGGCLMQKMTADRFAFNPSCNVDGTFTKKQCFLERCWCVDEKGHPIHKEYEKRFVYKKEAVYLNCSTGEMDAASAAAAAAQKSGASAAVVPPDTTTSESVDQSPDEDGGGKVDAQFNLINLN